MGRMRMMSMAFACLLAAGIAVPANATISDSFLSDQQGVTQGGEYAAHPSQQVTVTAPVSEEVLLIGAAVVGLIGISIMRKTLH